MIKKPTIRCASQIAFPCQLWLTANDNQSDMDMGMIRSEEELTAVLEEAEENGITDSYVSGTDADGYRVALSSD